ncbi:MAG: tRNA (adenosine(37)-N6)-threonylcarbamoyltransferase complex ATPase subunit type 1 TsaE [Patescibacteria group bacterium]
MEISSKSLEDTKKFAKDFVEKISTLEKTRGGATVVGLYGNLGSGKTTFVQCVAEILGVKEHLTSPTFVILKSYKLTAESFKLLHHIDAYRLKDGRDLLKLRFDELLADPKNLILIEWADLVADILPNDVIKLQFEFVDEKTRKIESGI